MRIGTINIHLAETWNDSVSGGKAETMSPQKRSPIHLDVLPDLVTAAVLRAREQERKYGHNTGHFTLGVEKENTVIGVIGEFLVKEELMRIAYREGIQVQVDNTGLGAAVDLEIRSKNQDQIFGVHVKTGLWKRWPSEDFQFGIHADQKIELSGQPLVLVSLLKREHGYPEKARIEGFITSQDLQKAILIRRGERFPSTGVISRTDNLVTTFAQYVELESILKALFQN